MVQGNKSYDKYDLINKHICCEDKYQIPKGKVVPSMAVKKEIEDFKKKEIY